MEMRKCSAALDVCPADFQRPRMLRSGCGTSAGVSAVHPLAHFGCKESSVLGGGAGSTQVSSSSSLTSSPLSGLVSRSRRKSSRMASSSVSSSRTFSKW